jgi:hypothetical protein
MWNLIIVIVGTIGINDVKHVQMTGDQCKAAVTELVAFRLSLAAGCVGPNGETFTFEDVKG